MTRKWNQSHRLARPASLSAAVMLAMTMGLAPLKPP